MDSDEKIAAAEKDAINILFDETTQLKNRMSILEHGHLTGPDYLFMAAMTLITLTVLVFIFEVLR
jgi:hypothetical protein